MARPPAQAYVYFLNQSLCIHITTEDTTYQKNRKTQKKFRLEAHAVQQNGVG